jgi:hypothetical protein
VGSFKQSRKQRVWHTFFTPVKFVPSLTSDAKAALAPVYKEVENFWEYIFM